MSDEATKVDPQKRAKIIDKIKKCLALAKSANENEAAAALRQAQKMMKAYAIEESEVEDDVVVSASWDSREKFSLKKPMSLVAITHLIGSAFGVMITWRCSPSDRHRVTYWGSRASTIIALHAHKMVYQAVNKSWDDYRNHFYAHTGGKAPKVAKQSFVRAWCYSVFEKVENLAPDKDKLARMRATAEAKMGMEPGTMGNVPERKSEPKFDRHAVAHGLKAGEDFSLHIPLTEQIQKDSI